MPEHILDEWQITTQNRLSIVAQAAIQIGAVLNALSDGHRHVHRTRFYLLGFSEIMQTKK
jgi:hypothetical protein